MSGVTLDAADAVRAAARGSAHTSSGAHSVITGVKDLVGAQVYLISRARPWHLKSSRTVRKGLRGDDTKHSRYTRVNASVCAREPGVEAVELPAAGSGIRTGSWSDGLRQQQACRQGQRQVYPRYGRPGMERYCPGARGG